MNVRTNSSRQQKAARVKGLQFLWHSCLLNGLLSGAALAADTGNAMTLDEFKAQIAAEKTAGSARTAPRASSAAPTEQRAGAASPSTAPARGTGKVMTVDEFITSLGQEAQDTAPRAPRAEEVRPAKDSQQSTDSQEITDNDTDRDAAASAAQVSDLQGASAAISTDLVAVPTAATTPISAQPATPAAPGSTRANAAGPSSANTAALVAIARTGGKLDLDTAVRQAMVTYPSIVESVGRLNAKREEIGVARAGYFPRVSTAIGSGYRRSNSDPWDSFSVSASQMLYDFGKVSSSVDAAASGAERNRAGVLLEMDDVARDTAEAFIEVQRFQALLKIAKEQTAAIADIQQLAEQRSQLGASTRSDALQAQSRHEAALATELQLQAQLDVWKRTLQNYIGREVPAQIDAAFRDDFAQACVADAEDFKAVPKVLQAEASLSEARANIETARANFFPTVMLNANYGNLNNPANVAFNPSLSDREFSVSVSLNSTLFQGGGASARRRAAEYSVQAAEAGKEAALLEVTRSFREASDQSRSFNERLRYLDARYDNVVNTQALYRQQYLSLGTRTLLDILNTEQEIHQSRFDQVHTLHDLRQMQIVCLHSLGRLRDAFGIDSRIASTEEP
jgi:adhesin transport system outer membrane protein